MQGYGGTAGHHQLVLKKRWSQWPLHLSFLEHPSLVAKSKTHFLSVCLCWKIEGCVAVSMLANAIVHSAVMLADHLPSFSSDPTSQGNIIILQRKRAVTVANSYKHKLSLFLYPFVSVCLAYKIYDLMQNCVYFFPDQHTVVVFLIEL